MMIRMYTDYQQLIARPRSQTERQVEGWWAKTLLRSLDLTPMTSCCLYQPVRRTYTVSHKTVPTWTRLSLFSTVFWLTVVLEHKQNLTMICDKYCLVVLWSHFVLGHSYAETLCQHFMNYPDLMSQTNRQTDRQTDSQRDRHIARQTDRQPKRQTDRQIQSQTDRQTAKETDRQTDRQTVKQTDKQPNRQTERQTDILDHEQTGLVNSTEHVCHDGRRGKSNRYINRYDKWDNNITMKHLLVFEIMPWSSLSEIFETACTTSVDIRKLEWLPFHVLSKYRQYVLSFRHKACVWQTDRLMDRQNYDPQDRASIAASRGNKIRILQIKFGSDKHQFNVLIRKRPTSMVERPTAVLTTRWMKSSLTNTSSNMLVICSNVSFTSETQ